MNHISNETKKQLGAVLRTARKSQGATLDFCASKLNIHKHTLSAIERGESGYSVDNLLAYGSYLGFALNIAPADPDYPHRHLKEYEFSETDLGGIEATTEGVVMLFTQNKKGFVLSNFQSAETDLEKLQAKIRVAADILAVVPLERLLEK